VISVSDDFFAAAKRMLEPAEPGFDPQKYDENGKWMDGWESRRKRRPGHDSCVIRICPGIIYGLDIDTSYFTGNFAPLASLEACCTDRDPDDQTQWVELLERTVLKGDSHQYFRVGDRRSWTHLRLNIYPDGGIARLRVFGVPGQESLDPEEDWLDLASATSGGHAVACSDMHFGDMNHLVKPGSAANMGDGWETRRRRKPGNDWVILKLGQRGTIRRIEVDTSFFKGNYPARCSLKGYRAEGEGDPLEQSERWPVILPELALGPDQLQVFQREVADAGPVTHVRFDIFPDGGVARLRLLGKPEEGC
jgi:allantoicase